MQAHTLELYVRRAAALVSAHDCPASAWQPLVVARCLQLRGLFPAAETFYRRAIHADPGDSVTRWLPAGAIVTRRISADATDLSDSVLWGTGKSTYQTLGLLLGVLESPDQGRLLELLDRDPRLRAIVELGRAEAGAAGTAIELLRQIPGPQLTPCDHLLLAELNLRQGHKDEVLQQYKSALRSPLEQDELWRVADVSLRLGATAPAGQAIDQLQQRGASNAALLALRIRWLAAEKKSNETRRLAESEVRRISGLNRRVIWAQVAADALSRVGAFEDGRRILDNRCRSHPQGDFIVARWLASQPGHASEAFELCRKLARDGSRQQAASLAILCLQQGDPTEEMTAQTEELVKQELAESRSAQLLQNVATLREVQGNPEEAIVLTKEAMQLEPENPVLKNNMAWYLGAYSGECEQALQLIDQAIRVLGPLDSLLDTKGVALLQAGQARQAVQTLETAAFGGNASWSVYVHLAGAYLAADQRDEARQALEDAQAAGVPAGALPFDLQLEEKVELALRPTDGRSRSPSVTRPP
jgi:tetratricopeptide (TPR) repeat protein